MLLVLEVQMFNRQTGSWLAKPEVETVLELYRYGAELLLEIKNDLANKTCSRTLDGKLNLMARGLKVRSQEEGDEKMAGNDGTIRFQQIMCLTYTNTR